ncbi:hypothetical protein FOCC_FOCC012917 [Frankliniella occidentalis]|nr:hypothetical protein FOCC_FOCC012917 [Frankliniella occidentalis]
MSVHYKFKSTKDYDTLTFDGLHISLKDLKKSIFQQKNLGKNTDFDLLVKNAQTDEVYTDEATLIPKNTSLIVHRVPLSVQAKRANTRQGLNPHLLPATKDQIFQDGESGGFIHSSQVDLARMEGSEDDKISAMMSQSTQDYDPANYQRVRNNQTGPLPQHYRCFKCHGIGLHWTKDCPLRDMQESVDIKKSTGIPRSFMVPVEGPLVPGAMMTPMGHFAVPAIDHQAYKEGKKERPPFSSEPIPEPEKPEIPEDLLCSLCKDLLTDAVMMPCCGNSFCDDCIRTFLLESDDQECPQCLEKEKTPEMLIPNRFLRKRVADFGDQTGYRKPHKSQPPPKLIPPEPAPPQPEHQPPSDPVPDSSSAATSSQTEGETPEQRPSPPPSPFIQPPISTGSGIPVLGAPIKTTSHHSDISSKRTVDKAPSVRKETKTEQNLESNEDFKHSKQDRHNRDRTYDRKRYRERNIEETKERERHPPRSHPSPHHNQPSSHPTGAPGDGAPRELQRVGYHLHEDRAGTPTVDERNLDAAASMHHGQASHHPPPPLHYADMSVPPPVVPQPYPHPPYDRAPGAPAYGHQRGYYDERTMSYSVAPQDPKYGYGRDNFDRGPPRYPTQNGSQAGHNLDPLEEFERRLRMKEENEKRREKLRQRSPRSRSRSRSLSPRERRPLSPRPRRDPLDRDGPRLYRSRTRSPPPRYPQRYPRDAAPYYDADSGYGRGRGRGRGGRGRSAGPGSQGGMIPPSYRKDYDVAPRDSYRYPPEGPYSHPPQHTRLVYKEF